MLNCRLPTDSYPTVIQDGRSIEAGRIRTMAQDAAARLAPFSRGRVALATRRVDAIAAAIHACQTAGCDLLLLREAPAHDASVWETWRVTGLLNDDLVATRLANKSPDIADPCILLPTSGTTGIPKIVRHHPGLLMMPLSGYTPPERGSSLICYHPVSFAGLKVILAAIVAGGQLVASTEPGPCQLAEAAMRFAPDQFRGTPTIMRSLLSLLGAEAASLPFTRISLAGEIVDQPLLDRLRNLLPHAELWHIYGASEIGTFMTVKDGRAGFPARWLQEGLGPVRLRIVEGVLEVASPVAMLGYLGSPMRDPEDPPAWWHTGDMIGIDRDRAHFLGRADNLINVGGAKVRPEEIEQQLLAIAGVVDARVFGLRNPISGQLVAAEVVAMPGIDCTDLRNRIRGGLARRLERYKLPQSLRIITELAIDPSGKKPRRPSPQ